MCTDSHASHQQKNSGVETKQNREPLSHATAAVHVLTIYSVNVTDTGPYVCNVTSMESSQTVQTQVIVHGEQSGINPQPPTEFDNNF